MRSYEEGAPNSKTKKFALCSLGARSSSTAPSPSEALEGKKIDFAEFFQAKKNKNEGMNFAENREFVFRFLIRGLEQNVDFSIPSGFNRGGSKLENRGCTSLSPSLTFYKVL